MTSSCPTQQAHRPRDTPRSPRATGVRPCKRPIRSVRRTHPSPEGREAQALHRHCFCSEGATGCCPRGLPSARPAPEGRQLLPRARAEDAGRQLPALVRPRRITRYRHFRWAHEKKPESNLERLQALGRPVKGPGAPAAFSATLLSRGAMRQESGRPTRSTPGSEPAVGSRTLRSFVRGGFTGHQGCWWQTG